ncbi:Mitochondrial carrier domain,Mitochondrial substrate/solute carrier [Cinara cedri]|uniref:Mitochondrial carrier domain,Mitochondrial substrate/solute carrier n=1 Tax=Cinara cedri TaxID=506608 RepID=A0A5E4NHQ2_9HEMI|nr:Mitochondrial carrier domain,Mitochondrial substrate/solute carrier [Cinara cedri]
MEFVLGAMGASGAVCFTNPLEVIKTRFQLQGELKKVGNYKVHYRNFAHAIYVVAKNEGPLALQKGLLPAMGHQVLLNGTRYGIFDLAQKNKWILKENGTVSLIKSVAVGAGAGMLGGFLGSPLGMLKIHLQSYSAQSIAVGYQRKTISTLNGLLTLYRDYGVVRGLWRGAVGAMVRIGVASSAQLSTTSILNEAFIEHGLLTKDQKFLSTLMSSMVGGVLMSILMAPFDLVSTRLYNQGVDSKGRGLLYKSYMECLIKTFRQEGVHGLYKGVIPCYLRLGPHVVLSMVFWERLRLLEKNISDHFNNPQTLV